MIVGEAGVLEDGRGVECDNVDTAHLLRNHHGERGEGGTTDSGNGEQLHESGDVVTLPNDLLLNFELGMDVVEIASRLEWVVSQPQQRFVRFSIFVLL